MRPPGDSDRCWDHAGSAIAQAKLGNADKSRVECNKALEIFQSASPNDQRFLLPALTECALARVYLNDLIGAQELLNRVAATEPQANLSKARALAIRSFVNRKLGKTPLAEADAQMALSLTPNYAFVRETIDASLTGSIDGTAAATITTAGAPAFNPAISAQQLAVAPNLSAGSREGSGDAQAVSLATAAPASTSFVPSAPGVSATKKVDNRPIDDKWPTIQISPAFSPAASNCKT